MHFQFPSSLIQEPQNKSIRSCGCYIVNHQYIHHLHQNTLLPLKHIEYDVQIVNSLASITLVQTYLNPTEKFLELQYRFPIHPNACVYKFVAIFGKKRIEGVVKEKEQAKHEYEQAVKQGKEAGYSEIDSFSKDMKMKIGNVAPLTEVKVQISYLHELELIYNTFYKLEILSDISPRFMNYIPKLTHYKYMAQLSNTDNDPFSWKFTINLKTSKKVIFFDSQTHKMTLTQQNDMRTELMLKMNEDSFPNKNLRFFFTTENFELPSYVLSRTDVSSTAMISFIPKFCTLSVDDAYKAAIKGSVFEGDIEGSRGEYIFLLDRSKSMGGKRLAKAKEALILFLKSLPTNTYFNVVSFGYAMDMLYPESRKYQDYTVNQAILTIQSMKANLGGTQILNPLHHLLNSGTFEGYPKQIFLLTDGGVSNTQEVIQMVSQNTKYARVHSIGIGNGCSEALILGCAQKGKGSFIFIKDQENPNDKIIQILTASLSPVISNMKLIFDKNIVHSVIPNPESLPYILKNEQVNFYVNFKGQLNERTQFILTYQDSQNKIPMRTEISIDPNTLSQHFVDKMGQFKKIQLLEESQSNKSSLDKVMYYSGIINKKQEIIKQSLKHQLLCEFTAFVCVEKELVDGKYEEVQAKGQLHVNIETTNTFSFPFPHLFNYNQSNAYKRDYLNSPMSDKPFFGMDIGLQSNNMNFQMHSNCKNHIYQNHFSTQMFSSSRHPISKMRNKSKIKCKKLVGAQDKGRSLKTERKVNKIERKKGSERVRRRERSRSRTNHKKNIKKNQFIEDEAQFIEDEAQFIKNEDKAESDVDEDEDEDEGEFEDLEEMKEVQIDVNSCEQIEENNVNIKNDYNQKQRNKNYEINHLPPLPQATMHSLISLQSIEGYWKNFNLLDKLYPQSHFEALDLNNRKDGLVILTYLVAKWIERHFPQSAYSLLVKKAMNWCKRNCEDFISLAEKYAQYVN